MKWMIGIMVAGAACYGQVVSIVDSGSTNTAGFKIVVQKSGEAVYTSQPRGAGEAPKTIYKTIPRTLAKTLYDDVDAGRPLSRLPTHTCVKSASFGTRLTVRFGDDPSPDLNCGEGGVPKLDALRRDALAIVKIVQPQ
jgi:hypothetical protein